MHLKAYLDHKKIAFLMENTLKVVLRTVEIKQWTDDIFDM